MQEEIFGPLLPVETYDTLDDAIARIASRPVRWRSTTSAAMLRNAIA